MAKKLSIEARHDSIERKLALHAAQNGSSAPLHQDKVESRPEQPYSIGKSQNSRRYIAVFVEDHKKDPAIRVRVVTTDSIGHSYSPLVRRLGVSRQTNEPSAISCSSGSRKHNRYSGTHRH